MGKEDLNSNCYFSFDADASSVGNRIGTTKILGVTAAPNAGSATETTLVAPAHSTLKASRIISYSTTLDAKAIFQTNSKTEDFVNDAKESSGKYEVATGLKIRPTFI